MSSKQFAKRLNRMEHLAQQRMPQPEATNGFTPFEYVAAEYAWNVGKGPPPVLPDFTQWPSPLTPLWYEQVRMVRKYYPDEPDSVLHPEDADQWRRMKEAQARADAEWEQIHEPLLRELRDAPPHASLAEKTDFLRRKLAKRDEARRKTS